MKKYIALLSYILLLSGITAFTSAQEWELEGVPIISRSQRGADESIRFLSKSKAELSAERNAKEQDRLTNLKQNNPTAYQAELKKIEANKKVVEENTKISADRNTYMKKNYPNDRIFDTSNDKMGDFYLLYQDQIKYNKTKLIVHHTAMVYDRDWSQQEIYEAIQRIYKYHTIDRDFGDLGYNFLIDHLGNIYEGRAGGIGAVGMHVAYNNIPSIGISLMGNYEEVQPTEDQIRALVNLLTALAKKYNINPEAKERYHQTMATYPYISSKQSRTIVGHRDIVATACPGKYLSQYLPLIRGEVKKRLQNGSIGDIPLSFIVENTLLTGEQSRSGSELLLEKEMITNKVSEETFGKDLLDLRKKYQNLFNRAVQKLKLNYFNNNFPQATNLSNKITYKYTLEEVRNLLSQNIYKTPRYSIDEETTREVSLSPTISVLLYELSTTYTTFEIECETNCLFIDMNKIIYRDNLSQAIISFTGRRTDDFLGVEFEGEKGVVGFTGFMVRDVEGGLVTIKNYDRKSYAGIPWNTFRGRLIFQQDKYKTLSGVEKTDYVVINQLSFDDYMKGIVETNDQEHLEKNKVMALIAKNYALFYLDKKNIHPSIPIGSSYSAIDSPESFQKYAGAGVEKTLKKRYQALEETKNQVVMYEDILPILPYFSCAPRFTLSAKEKRGRLDTPYLQSTFDLNGCTEFKGHGVGLAGQGAQHLAEKGATHEEILQYYYPGVGIHRY